MTKNDNYKYWRMLFFRQKHSVAFSISSAIHGDSQSNVQQSLYRLDFLDRCLCFQHLHDDLLLFNEERSDDPFADTLVTARSTVRARDCLETLRHPCPLLGTRRGDPVQFNFAVAAFRNGSQLLDVMINQLTTWSLHYPTTIGVSVVTQPTAQRQSLRTHFPCLGVWKKCHKRIYFNWHGKQSNWTKFIH